MRPSSEDELADAIRQAQVPFTVRGGGTRGLDLGGSDLLDMSGLAGVALYEPGALTLVAKAGTPLSDVEQMLAGERQHLAFEPADWRGLVGTEGVPTIGGAVAANISGPRRVQAGAARDACLGVRFVDGSGMVVKNGGRVMKNVTGYDLVKLMAGSWGQLGVLSEVSLKVLPRPEAEATLTLPWKGVLAAVEAMTVALRSPFDVTGAAASPDFGVVVRIEGFAGSVAYRARELDRRLRKFGPVTLEEDMQRCAEIWRKVRDVEPFHKRTGDVWRISVKPSETPGIAERIGGEVMLDWGGGLIWVLVPEGTDLRSTARPYGGHATLVRASIATRERLPRFEPEAPGIARLTAGLRAKFDPRSLFNPDLRGGQGPIGSAGGIR